MKKRVSSFSLSHLTLVEKNRPSGRKGYNGRVERSLRAFDEEFYRPYPLKMEEEGDFLNMVARWVYFYNFQPKSLDLKKRIDFHFSTKVT